MRNLRKYQGLESTLSLIKLEVKVLKLYELLFRHYSQKDNKEGIICYLVANSDEEVYEFIKSEPKIPDGTKYGRSIFNSWKYKDDKEDSSYEEGHKERLINCSGEMFDDYADISDLYYGLTHYGWRCVCEEITNEQISILRNCSVITVYVNAKEFDDNVTVIEGEVNI